jgi:hypothetical protein
VTAPQSSPNRSGWNETQLVAAEYTNLRAEVVKLTELQFQTTAATVVAFGTILSVGIQMRNAAISWFTRYCRLFSASSGSITRI